MLTFPDRVNEIDSMRHEVTKRLEESAQVKKAMAESMIAEIEVLVDKGDVVVGISTSGNSTNVVEAVKTAE